MNTKIGECIYLDEDGNKTHRGRRPRDPEQCLDGMLYLVDLQLVDGIAKWEMVHNTDGRDQVHFMLKEGAYTQIPYNVVFEFGKSPVAISIQESAAWMASDLGLKVGPFKYVEDGRFIKV